jgi:hypothetical protein
MTDVVGQPEKESPNGTAGTGETGRTADWTAKTVWRGIMAMPRRPIGLSEHSTRRRVNE